MADGYVTYDNVGGANNGDDEPRSAKRIIGIIGDAERRMDTWQSKCDRIDKLYSSLQSLAGFGLAADGRLLDREYNLFWASVEVIKPSIYSRPPVPVVTPKFKDRKPVNRVTAELLERVAVAGFDESDIDQVMLSVRDDLVINARGVIWLTYEDDDEGEVVCIEHLDRKDFGHSFARKWAEVGMVWRIAWLTQAEAKERFSKHSGEAYLTANYGTHKERVGDDAWASDDDKAPFYEVWDKTDKKVYWVNEGCEEYLDSGEPHLKLKGFFPCPRPAYGTMQRRSLIPVPDISYIEDQLETINSLTQRIHVLTEKLVVKGIIPAGDDVGDAIEKLLGEDYDAYTIIPVPSMSIGDNKGVEWLPIDIVAQAILSAVEARREIIGNVQELFGIADIMRGETDAQETATAQKLKSQYGSVRIRDRVSELVRIARDTVCIMVEIMAEEFSWDTLIDMSQMELPTTAEVKKQISSLQKAAEKEITAIGQKAEEAAQSPDAQQNPQAAQQMLNQALSAVTAKYQPQIEKASQSVTVEMVKDLLDDNKTRPFVFDIETDSTIYPDEQAEKESRNEFMQVFVAASQALAPLAMSGPAGAKMAGGLIKFQLGPYRAGRELEGLVDEWVESMENAQPQPNPDAEKNAAEAEYKKGMLGIETQKVQQDGQYKQAEIGLKAKELQLREQELQIKPQVEAAKEQIKQQGNVQAKELDAQVAVTRENAQLGADVQTKQMDLDAEAALQAQEQMAEDARFVADDEFRRQELAEVQALEYAKLDQQAKDALAARQQAALKPKGDGDA